jgi:hypothetical protein
MCCALVLGIMALPGARQDAICGFEVPDDYLDSKVFMHDFLEG